MGAIGAAKLESLTQGPGKGLQRGQFMLTEWTHIPIRNEK